MSNQTWAAIIGCVTTSIGLVKYLVTKLSDSNDSVISAQANHLDTFRREIKEIRSNYYEVISKLETARALMSSVQNAAGENNKQLKKFIELTHNYVVDSEKRIKTIEEHLGKITITGDK